MNFQDLVLTLQRYWGQRGCLIAQPYDLEKGAATFNPATFLRALGPEPFHAAFIEPCRRPKDGRYGDNPNRLQHYYQFQVVLKPSPLDIVDLYLGSLREIGVDTSLHDIRFVHDDWESPTLGAWGLGWEVWLDGMEITQFTYFQQVGGLDLKPIMGEITYGLERLCMYLQHVDNVFKLRYNDRYSYGDLFHDNEVQYSRHNFAAADTALHAESFTRFEAECLRLCAADLPAPAFDDCLKASHAFNLLDARGAVSVNERQGYILRVRTLAKSVAEAWNKHRAALGYPLLKTPAGGNATGNTAEEAAGEMRAGLSAELLNAPRSPAGVTAPLLVELGVEEMPARVFGPLRRDLPALIEKHLAPTLLNPVDVKIFTTPRRLAISISAVLLRQPDQKLALKGPPVHLAQDAAGQWSKAALSFAQKNGITPDQLEIKDNYLCAEVEKPGREALEILAEIFPKIFAEIHWYKTMRWGDGEGTPFVRPVTWLAALLGERVIPMAFAGVESTEQSRGHRFLHNRPVPIAAERTAYLAALREAAVIADADERRELIRSLLSEAADKEGLTWRVDEELLETVTYLTEYPVPVICAFDPARLVLPEEVLVSEMREHQKLFALQTGDGKLSHFFVAIANTEARDYGLIREGNASVVRARFSDAEFFLREDGKKKLADRRDDLKSMVFLKELGGGGSLYHKTRRVENLVDELGRRLEWPAAPIAAARQIAALCKNDLTTQMVGEFPDLQGIMGRHYALADGLPPAVADGIADHYRPRNQSDGFPETAAGALVGIADRLDTLVALFAKGKAPTGSADPFALRRACWTCAALVLRAGIRLPVGDLLQSALDQFDASEIAVAEHAGVIDALRTFFRGRVQTLFAEAGRSGLPEAVPSDTFDAAAGAKSGWEDLPGLAARLHALQTFRGRPGFREIAETFKRVSNILKDTVPGELRPENLAQPAEQKLLHALGQAGSAVTAAARNQAWEKALEAVATLRAPVAELFDAVMVNDPDAALRQNRQALLQAVREVVLEAADFSAFQIA